MGGADAPFLYEAPGRRQVAYPYSDFDPRAASRASWDRATQASKPRPKQEGPLVDFNKHPDSYLVVTTSHQTPYEPLPSRAKKWIIAMRWVQFVLRNLQLIGALGCLVCTVCLRHTNKAQGWMIRIPPGADSLISLYAVYHLVRPAKSRTPASSASYHVFAMITDVCFVPLYVLIAFFAHENYSSTAGTKGRWTSYFDNGKGATTTLLFATFLIAVCVGGLHLLSTGLDLYLIIMFRKIANLPPDMNPLEENLTSRRPGKHHYKNSELSLTSNDTFAEKKVGYLSGSTLASDAGNECRKVPFDLSRIDSKTSFSPHNPDSARLSRQQYEGPIHYQYPQSARSSRLTLVEDIQRPLSGAGSISPSKRGSNMSTTDLPLPPSRKGNHSPSSPSAAPRKSMVHAQQTTGLLNDNWYVLDAEDDADMGSKSNISTTNNQRPMHERRPTLPNLELEEDKENVNFVHEPLGMNPPTPTPSHHRQSYHAVSDNYPDPDADTYSPEDNNISKPLQEVSINRSLTSASHNTAASSVYSESAPGIDTGAKGLPTTSSSTPKVRYYGNLSAATLGVRGSGYAQLPQLPPQSSPSPRPHSGQGQKYGGGYALPRGDGRSPSPPKYNSTGRNAGRVVSRTGADIADESVCFLPAEDKSGAGGRRRMVSGKVAEEGLGGRWR